MRKPKPSRNPYFIFQGKEEEKINDSNNNKGARTGRSQQHQPGRTRVEEVTKKASSREKSGKIRKIRTRSAVKDETSLHPDAALVSLQQQNRFETVPHDDDGCYTSMRWSWRFLNLHAKRAWCGCRARDARWYFERGKCVGVINQTQITGI